MANPQNTKLGKKQGGKAQAAVKNKPSLALFWKKLAALPRRVLIFGGAAVALIVLLIMLPFFGSPRTEKPAPAPTAEPAMDLSRGPGGFSERPLEQPAPPRKDPAAAEDERPAIKSIRLQPSQPTRTDTLKAGVAAATYNDPGRLAYAYVWKVNDRIVAGAEGDTLNLAAFKKRDLVSVTVTPSDGDKTGFPVDSPVVAIYGVPPSLDLQAPPKTNKVGEALVLQLVSLHPDSETITFSLEAPLVPGMSIDSLTGKITWIVPPHQKGTVRFGAAVEDADKTKVTKTFDITME